jgi:hypothetical protein
MAKDGIWTQTAIFTQSKKEAVLIEYGYTKGRFLSVKKAVVFKENQEKWAVL